MSVATLNGIDIFYEIAGEGPPIIFIHGGYGGADSTVIPRDDSWVPSLSKSNTIITYDRRSAGRSSYPNEIHSLDMLTTDLRELILHLDLNKPTIIGSSAGGPISLNYTLNFQDDVDKLILVNTSSRLWKNNYRTNACIELKSRHKTLDNLGPDKAFEILRNEPSLLSLYLPPEGSGPIPEERKPIVATRNQEIKKLTSSLTNNAKAIYAMGILRNQFAYADSDLSSRLNEITIPTLVIHGDSDNQVPYPLGKELSEQIPNSQLVTIPNAGHALMYWDKTIESIKSFCNPD